MKRDRTRIAIILDRSDSMEDVREATVAGFNEFIREQKKVPGEASVLLVQFDEEYEVVFDKPLHEVPKLTQASFVPRGSTALLDAQGKTIVMLGAQLRGMDERERPSKVILVTLTDGLENASREYTWEQIAEMVKHQRETYNWDFVFLGANQDAVAVAQTMNIPQESSLQYAASKAGMRNNMRAASAYVGTSRSGLPAAFSHEDRTRAMSGEKT